MQASSNPWPRAPRKTTSCTECRRRKQKCNQGQPCNNCKRRFPEPVCEYGSARKREDGPAASSSSLPAFSVSLPGTPKFHEFGDQARRPSANAPHRGGRSRKAGPVVRWSGVGFGTEYPVSAENDGELTWEMLTGHELRFPLAVDEADEDRRASLSDGSSSGIVAIRSSSGSSYTSSPHASLWQLVGPLDCMTTLPIELNKTNALLIHTYSQIHRHFKGSFDGVPDADNPYIKHYVPFCIQSPLLALTSMYIAGQTLAQRKYIDVATTVRLKSNAIQQLNTYLRSEDCLSDEAMGAVGQFIAIELYYGAPEVMQAHLTGLREMVRLRGGFANSTCGSLATKAAVVAEAIVAISLEQQSLLQKSADFPFELVEPPPRVFRVAFNCPVLASRLPFSSCTDALGVHPIAGWILDEVGLLLDAVLDLSPDASPRHVEKIQSTAQRILERVGRLPENSPDDPAGASPETSGSESTGGDSRGKSPAASSASVKDEPKPHSLLPQYPDFKSSPSPSPPSPAPAPVSSPSPPQSTSPALDPLYSVVRRAALIYTGAIGSRRPFSAVCSPADALSILGACWRIPLSEWRGMVGVFLFVMLAIVPTAAQRASPGGRSSSSSSSPPLIDVNVHTRFAKSILQIGWMQVALENWAVCQEMIRRALGLQRWLKGKPADTGARGAGREGGEGEQAAGV